MKLPGLCGERQPKLGLRRGGRDHGNLPRPHHGIDPEPDDPRHLLIPKERIEDLDLALVVEVHVEAQPHRLGQLGRGLHRRVVHNQSWLKA